MSSNRGPRLLPLENGSTITRYMSWKDSLLYSLSLEATFAPFLLDGVQWKKKSFADPVRGLRDAGEGATLVTAAQRVLHLEMMLGQVANLCPIIARKSITDRSTSLSSIWQNIRLHLRFEKTGANFLDLDNIRQKSDESPEVFFQDLSTFMDDCLLTVESGITHHGEQPSHDEEVSRSRHKAPHSKACASQSSNKVCPICKETKKDHHHFLSACPYLPDEDRAYMAKARLIGCGDVSDEENSDSADETPNQPMVNQSRRVNTKHFPLFKAFYKQFGLVLILDTGAECNMIKHSVVQRIGATVTKSTQVAFQADGKTPLTILGETRIQLSRKGVDLHLEVLVVEDMEGDVRAGVPFMMTNDISIRPSLYQIIIQGSDVINYNSNSGSTTKTVRRSRVLRDPVAHTTLWPGELLESDVPDETSDTVVALEQMGDCLITPVKWPSPDMVECIGGKPRLLNDTDCPINLKRSQHVCQVSAVITPEADNIITSGEPVSHDKARTCSPQSGDKVTIDPDRILPLSTRKLLECIQHDFSDVFDPRYSQRKGRVPQYSKDNNWVEVQEKCDEIEVKCVHRRPEDIGTGVENLNPSFLVKMSNGSRRLVTACADVAEYCKRSPSLPDVSTPFKGTKVYTQSATGIT